jgi:transposase-like protein
MMRKYHVRFGGGLGEKAGMTSLAAYPTASGIRDTARVLRISTDTVLSELKKKGNHSGPKKLQNRVHAVYAPSHALSNAH